MSVLLFVVGAIATMAGVAMVGYGIPINEFSFGNTLIVAGTTATVGGLIVIALGAAVVQLQRIVETLGERTAVRSGRPLDMFDPAPGSRAERSRIPFPSRPKADAGIGEPLPAVAPMETPVAAADAAEEQPAVSAAPTLRNPDLPVDVVETYKAEEHEEFSLSPQYPGAAPAPADLAEPAPPLSVNGSGMSGHGAEPAFNGVAHTSPAPQEFEPKTSYFDAMWPAEPNPARHQTNGDIRPEPAPEAPMEIAAEADADLQGPDRAEPVAILKSGVVDGMGYTLYVDGSIEAELPQGTLHFTSINDLRDHLARTS